MTALAAAAPAEPMLDLGAPATPPSPVVAAPLDPPPAPAAIVATVVVEPPAAAVPDPAVAVPDAAKTLLTGAEAPASTAPTLEPAAPAAYVLTVPDGSRLDSTAIDRVRAVATATQLTNDQAQSLLNATSAEVSSYHSALEAATAKGGTVWTDVVAQFAKDSLADAEVGGSPTQLAETVEHGQRVLAKYDPTGEFKAFLDTTGWGSHKSVLRMFSQLHRALGEDSFVAASPVPVPPSKSLAERMFPNLKAE